MKTVLRKPPAEKTSSWGNLQLRKPPAEKRLLLNSSLCFIFTYFVRLLSGLLQFDRALVCLECRWLLCNSIKHFTTLNLSSSCQSNLSLFHFIIIYFYCYYYYLFIHLFLRKVSPSSEAYLEQLHKKKKKTSSTDQMNWNYPTPCAKFTQSCVKKLALIGKYGEYLNPILRKSVPNCTFSQRRYTQGYMCLPVAKPYLK